MVPISLFVTVEIVKFWQGFVFINRDPLMVDAESGETARCRNSNLMEDLGKVRARGGCTSLLDMAGGPTFSCRL